MGAPRQALPPAAVRGSGGGAIVTEFIGISLGLRYLGLPAVAGVVVAALAVIAAALVWPP